MLGRHENHIESGLKCMFLSCLNIASYISYNKLQIQTLPLFIPSNISNLISHFWTQTLLSNYYSVLTIISIKYSYAFPSLCLIIQCLPPGLLSNFCLPLRILFILQSPFFYEIFPAFSSSQWFLLFLSSYSTYSIAYIQHLRT